MTAKWAMWQPNSSVISPPQVAEYGRYEHSEAFTEPFIVPAAVPAGSRARQLAAHYTRSRKARSTCMDCTN